MARSAGGGGSRSSGGGRSMGGGMRSSSRSFGSSGRSHSSSSSGSYRRAGSSHSSSSSYHNRPNTGYRRGGSYGPGYGGYGYGYNRGGYYRGGGAPIRSGSGGCGCFTTIIIMIIIMIIFSAVSKNKGTTYNGAGSNETKVTAYLNHDKYKGSVDASKGHYKDDSEGSEKFIDSSNEGKLIDGFEKFYSKTGVYPFLYIMENAPSGSGSVNDRMQQFTDDKYEELFSAEGNLLFVYVASEDDYWVAGGHNIHETIDENAMNIIYGNINSKWDDGNLARRFGDALEESVSRIMTKGPWSTVMIVMIICLAVVIVLFIIFKWWQKKKQAEKEEAEHLEQILSQPLETFGSAGMDDLKGKYDGNNGGQTPPAGGAGYGQNPPYGGNTNGQYPPQ